MPLETGTYISDLVSSNPAHSDSVGAADSHLRFIKSTLLASFTAVTGAVTATHTQINSAVAAVVTGLAQAVHSAGAVEAPGVAFLGSLTTGLYSPAANQVALAANGVQALLATSTGVSVNGSISGGTGQLGIIGEPRLWLSNTLPAGSFAWLNGQAVNRIANPTLFTMWGTTYGVGDGTTTFNIPNFQDTVPIGRGGMGGAADPALVAASGITANIGTLGSIIGEGKHTQLQAELPAFKPAITITDPGHVHAFTFSNTGDNQTGGLRVDVNNIATTALANSVNTQTSNTGITAALTSNLGSATPMNVVQPAIVCNWIVLLG